VVDSRRGLGPGRHGFAGEGRDGQDGSHGKDRERRLALSPGEPLAAATPARGTAEGSFPGPIAAAPSGERLNPFQLIMFWLRAGLAGIAYVGFWAGGMVIAGICLPLARWRHRHEPPIERAAACQRWVQKGFAALHHYMRICRLVHFVPRSVDRTVPKGGFVFIANHPTLVDVAALTSVFGRLACIAKTSLFRAPFVGRILRWCVYLDGGDGDPFSGGIVVPQGIARLAQGMPILIFPEGTRSPEGGLYKFKRGAFEIACRAGVPIFPILIRCEPLALSKSKRWYQIPPRSAYLTLTPLPVIEPTQFGNDAAGMASACEAMYRYHLSLPTIPCKQSDDGNRSRAKASHR
jgi:1-acyl-sn-glycerol-3-phosphate acyltransferase